MKKVYLILAYLGIFLYACQSQQSGNYNLEVSSFTAKLHEKKDNAVILDVRTPQEYQTGRIENAQNIDYNAPDFKEKINALDKNKPYFVYCLAGGRSTAAVSYMRENGFKEVYNLAGGVRAWRGQGLPLVKKNNFTSEQQDKISSNQYQALINSKPRVLIDFYAPWCVPCIKMKPFLEELDKELGQDVAIIRIDVEENKKLSENLKIKDIPFFILYENGIQKWTHQGYIDKEPLKKILTQ